MNERNVAINTNDLRVIVKLRGGLGNQLFQLAAGLAFKRKYGANLYYDDSAYPDPDGRRCLITDISFWENRQLGDFVQRTVRLRTSNVPWQRLAGRCLMYRTSFMSLTDHDGGYWDYPSTIRHRIIWLDGYFQDANCVDRMGCEVRKQIQEELSYTSNYDTVADNVNTAPNSVAVHIRRGDYWTEKNRESYGVCGRQYYLDAMAYIERYVESPTFYVFSDDPKWCSSALQNVPNALIMEKSELEIHDLLKIASCSHHIIGNSSFAWWGAYLGAQESSVCIMPERWLNNPYRCSRQYQFNIAKCITVDAK